MPHLSVTIFRHSFYDFAMPTLEIVVLTYRRAPLLRRCLASLDQASRAAGTRSRVVVVVNGVDAESVAEIVRAEKEFPSLQIDSVQTPERLACGFARNIGIERARADWIYFADDDAWVKPDFFKTFFEFTGSVEGMAVVGGPNVTSPEMSEFQTIAGAVLGSPFAAGPFSRRYRAGGKVTFVDDDSSLILCNLFVDRRELEDYRFPKVLSCAEENHMLHFLDPRRSKRRAFHPGLSVFHERAHDMKRFVSSALRYGRGRGELLFLQGLSIKTSRRVLLAFGMALALTLFAPLLVVATYAVASVAHAAMISLRLRSWRAFALGVALTSALHVFYPIGIALGFIERSIAPTRSLVLARAVRRSRSRDR